MTVAWDSEPKLVVGLPWGERPCKGWLIRSWQVAMTFPPNTKPVSPSEYRIDIARNIIVEEALQHDATHVFFWDMDTIPPVDVLPRLFARKLPIVAGLYYAKKGGEKFPCAWKFVNTPQGKKLNTISKKQGCTICDVDVAGCGCVLIETEVFRKMDPPWFKYTQGDYEPWDSRRRKLGYSEDFYFFIKARKYGFKTMVDMNVQCHHEGEFWINGKDGEIDVPKV